MTVSSNGGAVQTIRAGASRAQRARQLYELLKCVGFVWTCPRDIRAIAQVRPMFKALEDLKLAQGRDVDLRSDVERIILSRTEHTLIQRTEEVLIERTLTEASIPWIGLAFPEYGGLTYKLTDFGADQARETIRTLGLDLGRIDQLRPPSRFKQAKKA